MQTKNRFLLIGGGVILTLLAIQVYKRRNMRLSKNFNWSEFESKDGAPMPADVKANIRRLVENLEIIRAALNSPIKITSGYRSPGHNASIPGSAKDSQHVKGTAADFSSPGYTPAQIGATIEKLIAAGKISQGGMGIYPTWVHYDIRGKKARW